MDTVGEGLTTSRSRLEGRLQVFEGLDRTYVGASHFYVVGTGDRGLVILKTHHVMMGGGHTHGYTQGLNLDRSVPGQGS
jgi:hypothetical protein